MTRLNSFYLFTFSSLFSFPLSFPKTQNSSISEWCVNGKSELAREAVCFLARWFLFFSNFLRFPYLSLLDCISNSSCNLFLHHLLFVLSWISGVFSRAQSPAPNFACLTLFLNIFYVPRRSVFRFVSPTLTPITQPASSR
jgi:hypothetical protein